jgi:hypothetical protein
VLGCSADYDDGVIRVTLIQDRSQCRLRNIREFLEQVNNHQLFYESRMESAGWLTAPTRSSQVTNDTWSRSLQFLQSVFFLALYSH